MRMQRNNRNIAFPKRQGKDFVESAGAVALQEGDGHVTSHEPTAYSVTPQDPEYRSISFSVLADAQREVGTLHEPAVGTQYSSGQQAQSLRDRISELKSLRSRPSSSNNSSTNADKLQSKHAPLEQSSKRAVTRKRPAIEVSKNPFNSRDPRFSQSRGDDNLERTGNKYSFLKDYRQSELLDLKTALKKTKDPDARERLKREIGSMENRQKAELSKEREKTVLREHRKREKEAVRQGKGRFFLKKSDQKRLALTDKFQDMSGRDRERAIQRKRKKESQRERRHMPNDRRVA